MGKATGGSGESWIQARPRFAIQKRKDPLGSGGCSRREDPAEAGPCKCHVGRLADIATMTVRYRSDNAISVIYV